MPATTNQSRDGVPSGYAIHRPTRADLPAIAEFTAACDLHDTGGVDFTEAAFEMEWAMSRFDPATDAWTIHTSAGELVAYAHVSRPPKVAPGPPAGCTPSTAGAAWAACWWT